MWFGMFTPTEVLTVAGALPHFVFGEVRHGFWKAIQYGFDRVLTRRDTIIELRHFDCRFQIGGSGDFWPIHEVFVLAEYHEVERRLPAGAVIVDVGAHIGGFAVWCSQRHPDSTIYAYEPHPGSFGRLRANLVLNGIQNVRAHPYAVAGQPGPRLLDSDYAFSTLYSTLPYDAETAGEGIAVEGVTLDDIFRANHITHCDLLKLDCEGAEFEILLNAAPETLDAIDQIILEYHDNRTGHTHPELVERLCGRGFEVRVEASARVREVGYLLATRSVVEA